MPVTPRDAATCVLVRDREAGLEVLMVRRHSHAGFAGGAYVFPGGAVDDADGSAQAIRLSPHLTPGQAQAALGNVAQPEHALGLHVAAIRETFEEAGVLLARRRDGRWASEALSHEALLAARAALYESGVAFLSWLAAQELELATDALVYFAHWITPECRRTRFDTRFFLARVPPHLEVRSDEREVFEHRWMRPREVIAGNQAGDIKLMPVTLKNLELLDTFATSAEAAESLRDREVTTVMPRVLVNDAGQERIVFPWEADYHTPPPGERPATPPQ